MLIAIEGIDCSGKATQSAKLAAALNAELISFPVYATPTGNEIKKCLTHQEPYTDASQIPPYPMGLMYAVDRASWLDKFLHYAKNPDEHLVCDRYTYSNVAYQCARVDDEKQRQELQDQLLTVEHRVLKLPLPDATIILKVPVAKALERLKSRGRPDAYEKAEFLDRVAHNYDSIQEQIIRHCRIVRVDGDRDIEAVHKDILDLVDLYGVHVIESQK